MEVGKILDNKRKKMVTLRHGDRRPQIVDSIRKRASSSGIITGVGGSIHISLYQLMCDDRGTYYCRSNSTHNRTNVLYRNVTVTATPHIPYMRVTPRGSRYHTGLDLHISCSGRVGSQFNSSFWRWEWRSANESNSWTDYPHLERIRHERPSQDPVSKCELQAASTLTHTITDLDDCRRIRCSIGVAKYSDEVTIRLLDTLHQCSQDGQPSLHHATLTLLVCTVSSLLVTGLGVTALLCLTLRRRRSKLQDAVVARYTGPQETGLQFISYPSVDTAMYGDSLKAPVSDSII
ncbi:uncharacterized protein [Haliotis cracherodii]|uniref:uncharacterized protein n=1 Tax=Haliotis cracherodii TaxID=6455 RepID=UPI0039E74B1B